MSFTEWLERIHERPRHERVRLMWVSAAATLVVVGVFFILSLSHELKVVFEHDGRQTAGAAAKDSVANKTPSLGDTLSASVKDFLSIFSGASAPQPPAVSQPTEVPPSTPATPRPSLPK